MQQMRVDGDCEVEHMRGQIVWVFKDEYRLVKLVEDDEAPYEIVPQKYLTPLESPAEPDFASMRVTQRPKPKPEPKTPPEAEAASSYTDTYTASDTGSTSDEDLPEENAVSGKNNKQQAAETDKPDAKFFKKDHRVTLRSRSRSRSGNISEECQRFKRDSRSRSKSRTRRDSRSRSKSRTRQASSCPTSHPPDVSSTKSSGKPPAKIKTQLCRFWSSCTHNNRCERGDWCTYAHGEEQLGSKIPDLPARVKYRERCKYFLRGRELRDGFY